MKGRFGPHEYAIKIERGGVTAGSKHLPPATAASRVRFEFGKPVESRADGDDAGRVQVFVTAEIVGLDVMQVHGIGHAWNLSRGWRTRVRSANPGPVPVGNRRTSCAAFLFPTGRGRDRASAGLCRTDLQVNA